MTESRQEPPAAKKPRSWLRRAGLGLLALALLLAVFHRPILFRATRYFVVRTAKKQNLEVDYRMEGSIFSSLIVEDLAVTPTGPGPVEHIRASRLVLDYSLPGLLRHGLPGFLERLELEDASIEITPKEKVPKQKGPRKAFKFPALFPHELRIRNVDVVLHQKQGDLEILDANLTLLPAQSGQLRVRKVAIPKFRTWENLSATTSYPERNLVLQGLQLDPDVRVEKLNLDASALDEGVLGLALDAELFTGHAELAGRIRDLNASNVLQFEALVVSLSLQQAAAWLHKEADIEATLRSARLQFTGPIDKPSGWSGSGAVELAGIDAAGRQMEGATLKFDMESGNLTAEVEGAVTAQNTLHATVAAGLPDDFDGFSKTSAKGTIQVAAEALPEIGFLPMSFTSGSLHAAAPFTLEDGVLESSVDLAARSLNSERLDVRDVTLTLSIRKDLQPDRQREPSPFAGLGYSIRGGIEGLRFGNHRAESINIAVEGQEAHLKITTLDVQQGDNTVSATGTATIPGNATQAKTTPVDLQFKVDAPDLKQFLATGATQPFEGRLTIDGNLSRTAGQLNGELVVRGSDLAVKGITAESADAHVRIVNDVARVTELSLRFDEKNTVTGSGEVALEAPHAYNGTVAARLTELARFEPLLAKEDKAPELAGSLFLDWRGRGNVKQVQHEGAIELRVTDARFGELTNVEAAIAGTYSPEVISLPGLSITSSLANVAADLTLQDQQLRIENISITQPQGAKIAGRIQLPLDLRTPKDRATLLPPSGPISAALEMQQVPIGPFLKKEDAPAPLTGTIGLILSASGTIAEPRLDADVQARQLKFHAAPDLDPSALDVAVDLAGNRLQLDATLRVPNLQPLTVKGSIPFSPHEVLEKKQVDPQTPVELAIRLPSSPVGWVSRVSPAVRFAEGSVAIDANIAGTIAQPQLSGAVRMSLPAVRFTNQNLPPINDFVIAIDFEGQRLTVSKLSGSLAGGRFSAGGQILFEPLTNPTFDLRLQSQNALVMRNETLTVRANADITLTGPLDAAAVKGTVALTNSRFFREIDILPIELPGRPAPKPPDAAPGFAFTDPPLKNWTFDIAIKTADPFLIRGNLADGSVNMDLSLAGTGESPALKGTVRITDFTASLPFSRLEITSGYAYFSPDDPFMPVLDIQGLSNIRGYRINVYIYGPATSPQTLFSSQPPLPQEDIISLLATGTTTEELTGSSDALAGRAAVLLFQKLSRMVFKRSAPPEEDSFLDRFEVDVGTIDPRTGRQELQARFRVADRFYLIGDLDIQGDVRGQVKYLIRFR